MEKNKKPQRRYDSQFKEQAVQQVKSGISVPKVAKALGISDVVLYGWVKDIGLSSAGSSSEELSTLRNQVKQLETERDILKKALAIFSQVK